MEKAELNGLNVTELKDELDKHIDVIKGVLWMLYAITNYKKSLETIATTFLDTGVGAVLDDAVERIELVDNMVNEMFKRIAKEKNAKD